MHGLKRTVLSGTAEWDAYGSSSRLCTAIGPLGELASETKCGPGVSLSVVLVSRSVMRTGTSLDGASGETTHQVEWVGRGDSLIPRWCHGESRPRNTGGNSSGGRGHVR
jgi:hypothetical protein